MKIFIIIVEKIGKPAAAGGGIALLFCILYLINLCVLQIKFWGCSYDDIEMSVQDVIQDDGYYEYNDSYVTTVRLRIKNNTRLDIDAFSGTIIIYNAGGEKLVEETSRFMLLVGNFAKGEEVIVDMYLSGLDNAKGKELYFSKTSDLRATFQFTKIEYTWDKDKEYKNSDPITILEPELTADGTTLTEKSYQEAVSLYNQGQYEKAMDKFGDLGYYKDSKTYYYDCSQKIEDAKLEIAYQSAITLMNDGKYVEAISAFTEILNYKDSNEKIYQSAISLMNNEKYGEAIAAFVELYYYKDSKAKIQEVVEAGLAKAEALSDVGDYEGAYNIAIQLDNDIYWTGVSSAKNRYSYAKDYDYRSAVYYGLKKVIIAEGIEEIPSNYFAESAVETVVLPNSIKHINVAAFKNCSYLKSINLPEGLLIINDEAFRGCSSLEITKLPSTLTQIGDYAFRSCSGLRGDIVIGNSVKSIGNKAFSSCVNLASVKIGNSVTSIGDNAFESCTKLTSVTIPASVSGIGSGAFSYCYRLVEVVNNSNLTMEKGSSQNGAIAQYAIEVHSGSSKLAKTGGYLFYTFEGTSYLVGYEGTSTSLIIPARYNNGNYVIHNYAFYKMQSITSITISDYVTVIGDYAFNHCENLASVSIGNSVTSIGYNAFECCYKMSSLTIGSAVTTIKASAFRDCEALTSIRIPASVIRIEQYAFYDCSSLKNVTFENTSNWYAASSSTGTGGYSLSNLANTSNAASYLTNSYSSYYWNRKQS